MRGNRAQAFWRRFLDRRLALLGVVLIAAALRLGGLHWDALPAIGADGQEMFEEQHLHPDERFLTMVTSALDVPESWAQYLDPTTSPLNPHNRGFGFFVYGTLPIFLTRLVAIPLDMTEYWNVHVVGRVLAASFSLASVLLLFLLGRRLYGQSVGLVAALLLALAALPIQQAHFFTVDAFADPFVVLGLLCAVSVYERGRTGGYAGFGLALGAAMACKLNLVLLAMVVVVAAALGPVSRARREGGPATRWLLAPFLRLAVAAVLALVVFRLLQPYAFAGPGLFGLRINPAWWANMQEVRELMSGARDIPPGHQWAGRPAVWFPLKNIVLWGLGPPLGIAAWIGWAAAGVELFRKKRYAHLVPWTWVLVLFAQQGTQWVKSLRYFLPLYPVLALFAAVLVVETGRRLRRSDGAANVQPASPWRARAAAALAVVVIGGAAVWAWAFTSIYRRPHSRIDASQWIYDNVPPGATIAFEVWDDPLPLRMGGRDAGNIYRGIELHNYAEDTPEKLELTLEALQRADIVVLSSNRLYDSIPRLPMRYPMMVRYYRHLFSGELGYRRVAEFTSYPRLLGFDIPDQKAEEAWSVYDHPRVQIFLRTPQWSAARARTLLTPPDWDEIDRLSPYDARHYRTLMMDRALQEAQRAGGTWMRGEPIAGVSRGLFSPAGFANRHPVVAWIAALEIFGLAAFPFCFAIFPRFVDRGWLLAKTVGLLLVGFTGWAAASLRFMPWGRTTVWGLVIALGAVSLGIAWRLRPRFVAFLRERGRVIAIEELVFWCFFAFLLWCRFENPDLWHVARGGEKPMDFAYLNAVVRSTFFPPYDPWFAGGYLNYYYFGFVLAAVPVLLTGVVPAVAYNLVVPTFFALTAAGAFTGAATLAAALSGSDRRGGTGVSSGRLRQRLRWGVVGAVLVVGVGNLTEVSLVVSGLRELAPAELRDGEGPQTGLVTQIAEGLAALRRPEVIWPLPNDWWFWNASRAIPHPDDEPPAITEFPFFTFLFADLHAHMMAMPVTLLVLAIAIHLALSARARPGSGDPPLASSGEAVREPAMLGLLAVAVGSLWSINTWDYPLALLLASVGLVLRETGSSGWLRGTAWWRAGWRIAAVAVGGRLAFYWFHDRFATLYTELGHWTGSRTPLGAYLAIHGLFLLILLGWVAKELGVVQRARGLVRLLRFAFRWRASTPALWRRRRWLMSRGDRIVAVVIGAGVVVAGGLLVAGLPLEAFLAAALAMTLALALLRASEPIHVLLCVLIAIGLGLSALVEHGVLSGDIGRMNTVFKLYLQIWLLWGTASAGALAGLVSRPPATNPARGRRRGSMTAMVAGAGGRFVFAAAVVLTAAAALLYTVLATPARLRDRFDVALGPGLDGSAFMATATHHDIGPIELHWDADAFRWLDENVVGTPVVLEASIPPYRWGSRVSMFTGLPTVLGWDWHQRQQRMVRRSDPVGRRLRDIERIYASQDAEQVVPLLRRYGVELVYVGQVERNYYPEDGLRKFAESPAFFLPLYSNAQVQIYQVAGARPAGAPPLLRAGPGPAAIGTGTD